MASVVYTGPDKFLNGRFFACATFLHGTIEILLQIAELFRQSI